MKKILLLSLFFMAAAGISAQNVTPVSYNEYMSRVYSENIGYAVEKLNVDIASSAVTSSKIFSDPSLSLEYGYNEDRTLQMGQGVTGELGKTISFGKRKAGIELASSEKILSEALLNDYLRNLKAEASIVYYTAVYRKELRNIENDAFQNISRLSKGDSLRLSIGDISEVDALQSRLEAGIAKNSFRQAGIDAFNAEIDLSSMLSGEVKAYEPAENLAIPEERFLLDALIESALLNRADLTAALQNVDVANKSLKVVRRERNTDVDLTLGVNYNTRVRNEEAPAPPYTGVTVGLSIPLKFSNFNKGALTAESIKVEQAEKLHAQARIKVQSEVVKAYNAYMNILSQIQEYDQGLLIDAKVVIDSKTAAYSKGNCSLLEVLNAQRTYDDIRRSYTETLYNGIVALIELRRSVGDIQ